MSRDHEISVDFKIYLHIFASLNLTKLSLSVRRKKVAEKFKKAIVKSVLITCISESSSSRGRGSFYDLFSVIALQPATVGIRSTYPILAIDIQSALAFSSKLCYTTITIMITNVKKENFIISI